MDDIKPLLIGRKEIEKLYSISGLGTVKRWIGMGIIPQPINERPGMKSYFSPTAPLKWDYNEVLAYFERWIDGAQRHF